MSGLSNEYLQQIVDGNPLPRALFSQVASEVLDLRAALQKEREMNRKIRSHIMNYKGYGILRYDGNPP